MLRLATNQKELLWTEASSLLIKSKNELQTRVDNEMKSNFKYNEQQFAGHGLSKDIIERLQTSMIFHHAYLYSKNEEDCTGVVHVHIVYDLEVNDDGNDDSTPVSAGYFEIIVNLNKFDGTIPNPMFCPTAVAYLVKHWLNQPAFWSMGIINLLRLGCNMSIFASNQHAEAVIKHEKQKVRDDPNDYRSEPAKWMICAWNQDRLQGMRFVKQYENAQHIIASRKEKHMVSLFLDTSVA